MTRKYRPRGVYQITTHMAVVLSLLIVFIAISYYFFLADSEDPTADQDALAELQAMRTLWEDRRPESFRYVVDRRCDCAPEDSTAYAVLEQGRQRTARFLIPIESGAGILIDAPPRPVWLDDVFSIAENMILSGGVDELRFDEVYGYPITLTTGDGDSYEVRDFQIDRTR